MDSGVYVIRNTIDGKVYVGSSVGIKRRWACHRSELRRGKHHNEYLQRSWIKHGEESFVFEVVLLCPVDHLALQEGQYIAQLRSAERDHGYNLDIVVSARKAVSDETRAKLRAVLTGRSVSDETRSRISAARKGTRASPDAKAAMSLAQTGRKHTSETIAKFRSHRHTDETKAKIARAHIGMVTSEETKEKIRQASKGKPGRKHDDETRRKMSESARKRWERQRLNVTS